MILQTHTLQWIDPTYVLVLTVDLYLDMVQILTDSPTESKQRHALFAFLTFIVYLLFGKSVNN